MYFFIIKKLNFARPPSFFGTVSVRHLSAGRSDMWLELSLAVDKMSGKNNLQNRRSGVNGLIDLSRASLLFVNKPSGELSE